MVCLMLIGVEYPDCIRLCTALGGNATPLAPIRPGPWAGMAPLAAPRGAEAFEVAGVVPPIGIIE